MQIYSKIKREKKILDNFPKSIFKFSFSADISPLFSYFNMFEYVAMLCSILLNNISGNSTTKYHK